MFEWTPVSGKPGSRFKADFAVYGHVAEFYRRNPGAHFAGRQVVQPAMRPFVAAIVEPRTDLSVV